MATTLSGGIVVFQFTPLHERQPGMHQQRLTAWFYFNSRLYMRGNGFGLCIFICNNRYFNSRLYMRGNDASFIQSSRISLFQFTPLHERQQSGLLHPPMFYDFNSRLYMRGNQVRQQINGLLCISIHAST